jgi:hypothetical protein
VQSKPKMNMHERLTRARRQWGFDFPTALVGVRELSLDGRHSREEYVRLRQATFEAAEKFNSG